MAFVIEIDAILVNYGLAECDRLCHNNQDGHVLELCTFDRGSLKV